MKIAQSHTRREYPLNPMKILKKTLGPTVFALLLLIVLTTVVLLSYQASDVEGARQFVWYIIVPVWAAVFVGVFVNVVYQYYFFASYFYDLTEDYLVIRKNPITPTEITIPYERLQDVYVDQDLLDRFLGLYDVHVSSATSVSGIEAHIDGLPQDAADGLRKILLDKIRTRISQTGS